MLIGEARWKFCDILSISKTFNKICGDIIQKNGYLWNLNEDDMGRHRKEFWDDENVLFFDNSVG